MAGPVPARLPAGEVEGVGVDFFTTAGSEKRQSDWQLFADGGSDGWYGYLDGPDGVRSLPGTLTIDHDRLIFHTTWASIGSPTAGSFSTFVDWVRAAVPLNVVTADRAPDAGRGEFSRT